MDDSLWQPYLDSLKFFAWLSCGLFATLIPHEQVSTCKESGIISFLADRRYIYSGLCKQYKLLSSSLALSCTSMSSWAGPLETDGSLIHAHQHPPQPGGFQPQPFRPNSTYLALDLCCSSRPSISGRRAPSACQWSVDSGPQASVRVGWATRPSTQLA